MAFELGAVFCWIGGGGSRGRAGRPLLGSLGLQPGRARLIAATRALTWARRQRGAPGADQARGGAGRVVVSKRRMLCFFWLNTLSVRLKIGLFV